jgi:hypothetical protein
MFELMLVMLAVLLFVSVLTLAGQWANRRRARQLRRKRPPE